MSFVSVIIPAYNGAAYIDQAIASILNQTYGNYEIIVIDDGSTDNTAQIVSQYSVKFIQQANQGVAQARNKGLEVASGKYIAFLDQDDYFLPHKLAYQVGLLERQAHIGIVNSGWQIVNELGNLQAEVQPWLKLKTLNPSDMVIWKPVFLGAILFRRSWLEKTTGFNPQLEQTPDVEICLHLAALGCPGAWIEQTTVAYRQHRANASKDTPVQAQELNHMLGQFFDSREIPPEIRACEKDSRYQSLVWSAWRLYDTGYVDLMQQYLLESLDYSDRPLTEVMMQWIRAFSQYASEYGRTLEIRSLTSSPQWQKLLQSLLEMGRSQRSLINKKVEFRKSR